MKLSVPIFCLLLMFGCKNKSVEIITPIDYTGFRNEKIVLAGIDSSFEQKDTLGLITLKVPQKLDTFYHWIDHSDCPNCGYMYYRFANKKYCLNEDYSGMGIDRTARYDSFYQCSIMIKPFRRFKDYDSAWQITEDDLQKTVAIYNANDQIDSMSKACRYYKKSWIRHEIKTINGRKYLILAYRTRSEAHVNNKSRHISSGFPYKIEMTAFTYLKDRALMFYAECDALDTTGFVDNMYKSLLSLKYSPPDSIIH